jgi:hypothetical protein
MPQALPISSLPLLSRMRPPRLHLRETSPLIFRTPYKTSAWVDAEQVDAAVAGDGLGQHLLVGCLDKFADQVAGV